MKRKQLASLLAQQFYYHVFQELGVPNRFSPFHQHFLFDSFKSVSVNAVVNAPACSSSFSPLYSNLAQIFPKYEPLLLLSM